MRYENDGKGADTARPETPADTAAVKFAASLEEDDVHGVLRAFLAGVEYGERIKETEVRHERHDGAWAEGCILCDHERQAEGQVWVPGHGWTEPV